MHPGLVDFINKSINIFDWMSIVGGAIRGHLQGTKPGGLAMRQAIDGEFENPEYKAVIEKWGIEKFSDDLSYRIF